MRRVLGPARRLTDEEAEMHATVNAWMSRPPPAIRAPARWWPALLLAAAAVGALWVGARGPASERTPSAGGVPVVAPAPVARTITVDEGASVLLRTPRTVVGASVDGSGVSVHAIQPDHVLVIGGAAAGHGVVRIELEGGGPALAYTVDVGPARTEPAADDATLRVAAGSTAVVPIHDPPVVVRTTADGVASAARRGDELLVDVTGHRAGIVDLWVVYAAGPPDVWVVQVTP